MRFAASSVFRYLSAAAIVGAALAAPAAQAQNLVLNGSFELPSLGGSALASYGPGSTALTNWTIGGNGIDHIGGLWAAQNGSQSLDMNAIDAGSISQIIATTPGQLYDISFFIAANTGGGPVTKNLRADFGLDSFSTSFNSAGLSNTSMGWSVRSFTAVATSNFTTISFTSLNPGSSAGAALDNVSVVARTVGGAAPEPGSLALLLPVMGAVGVVLRRRK
jgi:choice-of-anchor C domain-containing protein